MCGGDGTAMCGEPRVAAECTCTERKVGRCSRPTVRPGRNVNDERDHGAGSDTRPRGRWTSGSLTETRVRDWQYLPERFDGSADRTMNPCSLDGTDQLARTVLAACVEPDGPADADGDQALVIDDARHPTLRCTWGHARAWTARAASCRARGRDPGTATRWANEVSSRFWAQSMPVQYHAPAGGPGWPRQMCSSSPGEMCAPRVASNIRSTAAGSMARPSALGSWSSYSRGRRADVEALTERDRCCGCCPQRTVLGLCIFVSRARGRLASLRFSRACVECPRPENVHVWEASARRYESRGRPRGRTGRSSDFARRLTSTRMVSGATWCAAARSRAATAGRHTRNRTSHSKMAPLRGRSTGGVTARGRVLMRGAHRSRSSVPRAARGCAAQNHSVRQASSRIQTVSSLHRRAHRRIPVSTS